MELVVLRLLRGEALDAVSRESQVPAHELERWQRIFLEVFGQPMEGGRHYLSARVSARA